MATTVLSSTTCALLSPIHSIHEIFYSHHSWLKNNHDTHHAMFAAFQNEKELAGLQPANYSHGRRIPMHDSTDRNWNFPEILKDICISCGNAGNANIDECNCTIIDDVVDNIVNNSMDESFDTASVSDDKKTAIFNALQQDDSSVEDLLSIDNDSVVETPQNPHCDNNQNDTEKDNESPNLEYTYNSLNELGNKIISFPELKSCIEDNFVCKKCFSNMNLSAVSRSKLMV